MFREDPEDIAPRSAEQGRYSMRPQVCEGAQACERRRPPTSWRRTVSDARRLPVEPGLLVAGPVVGDVVRDEVPDVRPVGEAVGAPAHRGPRRVLLELLLDDTGKNSGVTHAETMARQKRQVNRRALVFSS